MIKWSKIFVVTHINLNFLCFPSINFYFPIHQNKGQSFYFPLVLSVQNFLRLFSHNLNFYSNFFFLLADTTKMQQLFVRAKNAHVYTVEEEEEGQCSVRAFVYAP